MSAKEQQDDEREALVSIYEGDTNFKVINPTTYQYKYGEDEQLKSFVIELVWGDEYPELLPAINMEAFYNRNLSDSVKEHIISVVTEEGQNWIGCGMTYTLFEFLKDKLDELLAEITVAVRPTIVEDLEQKTTSLQIGEAGKAGPKKEQLTKSQKRKQWNRAEVGTSGSKPRGYDWVDIVKHLSQTGGKDEVPPV